MTTTALPFDDHTFTTLLDAAHQHEVLRWTPDPDVTELGRSRMALEDARRELRSARSKAA